MDLATPREPGKATAGRASARRPRYKTGVQFVYQSLIPAPPARVFAFHEERGALQTLTPPWAPVRIVEPPPSLLPGSQAVLRVRLLPLVWVTWVARHTRYEKDELFEDEQVRGPFRRWLHTHRFQPAPGGTLLRDEVDLELPLGRLARPAWPLARLQLQRLFAFRHEATRRACAP